MPTNTSIYNSAAGGNATDVVVDAGQVVVVIATRNNGQPMNFGGRIDIHRKVGAVYVPVSSGKGVNGSISQNGWEVVLSAPGEYRFVVPATPDAITLTTIR